MTVPAVETLELLPTAGRIVVAVVFLVIFSRLLARKWKSGKHGKRYVLPPGPRPLPIVGNLTALSGLPHVALKKLTDTYGPLMYLRLGSVPTIVASSAAMAEEVLKTHDKVLASRPHMTIAELMGYGGKNMGFLPYGEEWRNARKMFTTKLVTNKRLDTTENVRKEETLLMLRSAVEKSRRGSGGKGAVPVFTEMFQLTVNIISRLMFSKRMYGPSDGSPNLQDTVGTEFQKAVTEAFALFGAFVIGDYIPWLKPFDIQGCEKQMKAAHTKLDYYLQGLLDARWKELQLAGQDKIEGEKDCVTVMLTHNVEETGERMAKDQVKGMMMDVLLAGSDTTSSTLEWALAELLKNPEAMRMCMEELDRVVGRDRLVAESDLPSLPYLQAVVKEILRLHPAGPLLAPHFSTADFKLGEYFIPAKTQILINMWDIQRDPAVWENPLRFLPSRFLRDQADADIDLHGQDYKFLPFSAGRRGCPGKPLALRVVPYVLAVMLQTCEWSLPESTKPEDMDMSEKFDVTSSKAEELKAVPTLRVPASMIAGPG